ncbi:MAG: C25 family cysteine peptidase [Planctomycetota bacterium]
MAFAEADEAVIDVSQATNDLIMIDYLFPAFDLEPVMINKKTYHNIASHEKVFRAAGDPDLPGVARSVIIPDLEEMVVNIVDAEFVEIEDVDILPSKGSLARTVDPGSVPYTFGKAYETDAFFPDTAAVLGAPYIMRDYRGIVVTANPFQYNPVQHRLRVYTSITVEIKSVGLSVHNPLIRAADERPIVKAFRDIYSHHFINAELVKPGDPQALYANLDEDGDLLIICYDAWIANMQPLADHKNGNSLNTTIVGVSTIGNNATSIKNYIQNVYNSSNLAFVLLVGDYNYVATPSASGGASDPTYSKLAGGDSYPDIMVGRFSAESSGQVDTMVTRTIAYEVQMQNKPSWYWQAMGIASAEGGSWGDDGETDIQHMNNVRTELLGYSYSSVDQIYDPGASASTVNANLNAGRGLVNYVGHGSIYSWSTTGYSASHIDALTNVDKLPFIFSVACVVGDFDGYTCFCESWLRATSGGNPTGAVAIYGSSINQDWAPPMQAQDEFNHLITLESYATLGAYYYAASCSMMDNYGSGSSDSGTNMFNTWHIFGDPSLNLGGGGGPGPGVNYPTIYGNTGYEYVNRVQAGSIDNTSGNNGGYGDYTAITANMEEGASYPVTLTPGFVSGSYTEYWKLWIDLNHDGDFTDTGEELFSGSGSSAVSGAITIPSGTAPVTTRMRVAMKYGSAPASSGDLTWGEGEDYTIDIIGGQPQDTTPPNPDPMTWATPPFATGTDSISMTATTATDPSGVEYYFYCLTAGGHDSGWQSGTTYVDNGLAPDTTYMYQVMARDLSINQNGTAFSTAASATTNPVSGWVQLTYDDFESGWGSYVDGGGDCARVANSNNAHQGTYSADIQDNSGVASSFYYASGVDVHTPGYTQIKIEFWYKPVSMDNTSEDFWVQYFDGSTWHTVASYARGIDFNNNYFYNETVTIDEAGYNFPTNMKIRFMCDASGNQDDVYIDEIRVSAQ